VDRLTHSRGRDSPRNRIKHLKFFLEKLIFERFEILLEVSQISFQNILNNLKEFNDIDDSRIFDKN
jgi:hypothetical protein